MKAKVLECLTFLLILLFAVNLFAGLMFIDAVHAQPTYYSETLYVGDYDETAEEWSKTGTDPYLNAIDSSYISTTAQDEWDYWYIFDDLTLANIAVYNVTCDLYIRETGGSGDNITLYVYCFEPLAWTVGNITAASGWGWVSLNCTANFDTVEEVNGMRISVVSTDAPATAFYIDCARVVVWYAEEKSYYFYGLYDELTGLRAGAVNVTAYSETETPETFEVDGSYIANLTYVRYFVFDLQPYERRYWVSDEEQSEQTVSIYLFNGTNEYNYLIQFDDYQNLLDDYPFISLQRLINGSLYVVEQRRVDVSLRAQFALSLGETYTLRCRNHNQYTIGSLFAGTDQTPTVTIPRVEFPDEIAITYRYIRCHAERDYSGSYMWITPNNVSTFCGETGANTANQTIDENVTSYWQHATTEYHNITLDLGASRPVQYLRIYQGTASEYWGGNETVNVYVLDTPYQIEAAVWTGLLNSSGWQQTGDFAGGTQGRYIRLSSNDNSTVQRLYEIQVSGVVYGTSITALYEDTRNQTISVVLTVTAENGTVVYTDTKTDASFIDIWAYAEETEDYTVSFLVNHREFGLFTHYVACPQGVVYNPPFSLDLFGILPFASTSLLPFMIILFCCAAFSAVTVKGGIILTLCLTGVLIFIGWIDINLGSFTLAFTLAVIMVLGIARREER